MKKQKELDPDPKSIQQIECVRHLKKYIIIMLVIMLMLNLYFS